MWPFLHTGEDDEIEKVPVSTLFRWFLYDMGEDSPNQFASTFSIATVSEEGDQKEREESDKRTERLNPLLDFFNLYASMNAQYIYETQKADFLDMPDISPEDAEKESSVFKTFYSNISFDAVMGTFSAALELGLIRLNGTFTAIE